MDKIIKIDGKEVGFRASARTPRDYRNLTGRDVIQDVAKLQAAFLEATRANGLHKPPKGAPQAMWEDYNARKHAATLSVADLRTFEDLAFVMAFEHDPVNTPADVGEWLDQFEFFSIYEVLPQILKLWNLNNKTSSKPKNG